MTFKALGSLIIVLVGIPIWLFLLHHIWVAVNASEFMWFLYYIYIPINMLVGVVMSLDKQGNIIMAKKQTPVS